MPNMSTNTCRAWNHSMNPPFPASPPCSINKSAHTKTRSPPPWIRLKRNATQESKFWRHKKSSMKSKSSWLTSRLRPRRKSSTASTRKSTPSKMRTNSGNAKLTSKNPNTNWNAWWISVPFCSTAPTRACTIHRTRKARATQNRLWKTRNWKLKLPAKKSR